MQIPETLERVQEFVAIDQITKLLKLKEPVTNIEQDSIIVITDKLTKYAYFLLYKEASTAKELSYQFIKQIIANYSILKGIVSDRDKLFTSNFQKLLILQLGVKQKMSTAYHPQINGQAKRLNQILVQFLRSYINYQQDDQVELLLIVQFIYNSTRNETIGQTLYYTNYGQELNIYYELEPDDLLVQYTRLEVDQLKEMY